MKKLTTACYAVNIRVNVVLAFLCGSLIISSCGGSAGKKKHTNDWVAMGLKGQVQKMVEKDVKSGISDFYTFNEKGYFVEKGQISDWPLTKTIVKEQYEYDANGKISVVSYFSEYTGDLKSKKIYKDGLPVEEQTFDKNISESGKPEYTLTATTKISGGDESCYEYDSDGNLTHYVVYNRKNEAQPSEDDGELNYEEKYKYDDNNRLVEQCNIIYLYNSGKKKNEIRQKRVYTYQYDEQGNVIESSGVVYGYKEGKEQEPSNPEVTTYVYVYDKHGNWTSKETKYKGITDRKVSRKYTYFGEEAPKFTAEDMVGAWDYYCDPSNKIEMIFKKDGTLIDYIDFHSTGTYKVDPEGKIITMQFTYNDGHESSTSKPIDYVIMDYTGDRLVLQYKEGSDNIYYDRKAKSQNYDGEY